MKFYEHCYYLLQGKTKICYGMNLDFYDLDDNDMNSLVLCGHKNQTVRYDNHWFVVKEKVVHTVKPSYPKVIIKFPHKKAMSIEDYYKAREKAVRLIKRMMDFEKGGLR